MLRKDLAAVQEVDLQSLVDNAVFEKKVLGYERTLPCSDAERREFLAEVCSFANTIGGELVYGVALDSKTGFPCKLEGLSLKSAEQEVLKLKTYISEGIEPIIPSVIVRPVVLSNSRVAILVRIQKSWNAPHRVKYLGYSKFYSRNTNGKYEMDLDELRIAFSYSDVIADKIRKFRENRISKLYSNEMPIPFARTAKVMLHLMPLISFTPGRRFDIERIANQYNQLAAPIYCGSYSQRYNLDGFLCYSSGEISDSYCQIFRNGVIEVVEACLLKPQGEELLIPSVSFEEELIESLPRYMTVLKTMRADLPFFVFLTLVGVKGYSMSSTGVIFRGRMPIEREVLNIPEIMVDKYDLPAAQVLRPLFDSVWNACGFERSLNYDGNGEWRAKE